MRTLFTRSETAAVVLEVLAHHGPLGASALATELRRAPEFSGLDPRQVVEDLYQTGAMPLVTLLPDNRWCNLGALMAGRVVTHRLTADEVGYGFLTILPDLAPLLDLIDHAGAFEDGTPAEVVYPEDGPWGAYHTPEDILPEDGGLPLPPDFFKGKKLKAGDVVTVRATLDTVSVDGPRPGVTPQAFPAAARDALVALVGSHAEEPLHADVTSWALCASMPELLHEPTESLSELLEQTGVMYHHERLFPPNTDLAAWEGHQRIRAIAQRHGLDEDDALAVAVLVTRYEEAVTLVDQTLLGSEIQDRFETGASTAEPGETPDPGLMRMAINTLGEPTIARALLGETLGSAGPTRAAALGVFADMMTGVLEDVPGVPDGEGPTKEEVSAALTWLRARAMEGLGRAEEAHSLLRDAYSLAPHWPPVLADLAHYASDRGDLMEATDLARRAGSAVDEGFTALLAHLRAIPGRDLGRNQPCWCGSGRKYKVCHLGREQLPLADRAAWLYQKAGAFVERGEGRETIIELALERGRHLPDGVMAALQDPLVFDVALTEAGEFEEFLRQRGGLLPEDERALAQQWALIERSVWEIEEVRPTRGLTMRDLRTGDRRDVREATASRTLKPGMLVCTRVLPAGETWQMFGGVQPVGPGEREALMDLLDHDPDPLEIIALLSRRYAPPQLRNTDGDPMLMGEIEARVPSAAAAATALDRTFEREPGTDGGWNLFGDDSPHANGRTIRATLRLTGDLLEIDANSERRLDEVLATVLKVIPRLAVTSDRRAHFDDLLESPGGPPTNMGSQDSGSGLDPEIEAQLIAQLIAQHEAAWVDESIPALSGLTPREAAADPTRREDLIRLLATFPPGDVPDQMSAHRLRSALGLD